MKRWGYPVAAIGWMSLIFWLSTGTGSTENTRPMVAILIDWIQPGLSDRLGPDWIGRVDWVVRKAAHMTEYAILTGFLLGTFGRSQRFGARKYALAPVVSILYAASDEWHQSMVPGRYATVGDVGWDAVGTVLLAGFHRRRTVRASRHHHQATQN